MALPVRDNGVGSTNELPMGANPDLNRSRSPRRMSMGDAQNSLGVDAREPLRNISFDIRSILSIGEKFTEGVERDIIRDTECIIEKTNNIRRKIVESNPDWNDKLVRLATATLAIYRTRPCDFDLHQEVLLIHIIEGGISMRAHNGTV